MRFDSLESIKNALEYVYKTVTGYDGNFIQIHEDRAVFEVDTTPARTNITTISTLKANMAKYKAIFIQSGLLPEDGQGKGNDWNAFDAGYDYHEKGDDLDSGTHFSDSLTTDHGIFNHVAKGTLVRSYVRHTLPDDTETIAKLINAIVIASQSTLNEKFERMVPEILSPLDIEGRKAVMLSLKKNVSLAPDLADKIFNSVFIELDNALSKVPSLLERFSGEDQKTLLSQAMEESGLCQYLKKDELEEKRLAEQALTSVFTEMAELLESIPEEQRPEIVKKLEGKIGLKLC